MHIWFQYATRVSCCCPGQSPYTHTCCYPEALRANVYTAAKI